MADDPARVSVKSICSRRGAEAQRRRGAEAQRRRGAEAQRFLLLRAFAASRESNCSREAAKAPEGLSSSRYSILALGDCAAARPLCASAPLREQLLFTAAQNAGPAASRPRMSPEAALSPRHDRTVRSGHEGMARKYFGTDGIRGATNVSPMTAAMAMKVGMAAGAHFLRGDHKHRVVIGKDTRLSGYMLESAMVAGFTSVGMDVVLVGPMPTPAVAMLTRSLRADLGVMISASHNPYDDNGIKLFRPDGYKLSDDVETSIEELMDSDMSGNLARGREIGRAHRDEAAQTRYIEFAKRTLPKNIDLTGLRVVIDCANGAAYKVAPTALWELGAEVFQIGVEPDGFNINDKVGSTAPDALRAKVKEVRADIGIALDGDADRVIIVDEHGEVVDGDQLMAVIAQSWQAGGSLKGGGLVATVMSNLGLERYLRTLGLGLE
eukprot:gene36752-49554_t